MFGAFKPSAPLSGGLLWKIPWRLSPPQKLRHRRRMRRVDNIVTVLSSALRNRPSQTLPQSSPTKPESQPAEAPNHDRSHNNASPEELSQTAQGTQLLASETQSPQTSLRHGRGPRQGDMLPTKHNASSTMADGGPTLLFPTNTPLGSVAREEGTTKLIERWKVEMPTEGEMLPRDKYTMFDRKARGYRKGVHKLPKWTRLSQRVNPPGF